MQIRYAILTAALGLSPLLAMAQEGQRIRDYSLSPAESLRLPNVTHNSNPYAQFPNQGGFGGSSAGSGGEVQSAAPAARFMDGYCDPNFKPMLAGNDKIAGMQSCLAQQKQQQCATFNSLPADVQRVIDDTASCLFSASNAEGEGKAADCSGNDSLRLQLMRKYNQNQVVAHALESLPEDIMNASNTCMGRR